MGLSLDGFSAFPSLGACSFVCSLMATVLISLMKPCVRPRFQKVRSLSHAARAKDILPGQ